MTLLLLWWMLGAVIGTALFSLVKTLEPVDDVWEAPLEVTIRVEPPRVHAPRRA